MKMACLSLFPSKENVNRGLLSSRVKILVRNQVHSWLGHGRKWLRREFCSHWTANPATRWVFGQNLSCFRKLAWFSLLWGCEEWYFILWLWGTRQSFSRKTYLLLFSWPLSCWGWWCRNIGRFWSRQAEEYCDLPVSLWVECCLVSWTQ